MISLFTNATVRSADDLLADLAACRQMRHLSDEEKRRAVDFAFAREQAPYKEPTHIGQGFVCEDCGKPRSDYSTHKCSACYVNNTKRPYVWTEDAFKAILGRYGYRCDTCDTVTTIPTDLLEAATSKVMRNMDGAVFPILCKKCSTAFVTFCTREFGQDGRAANSADYEKMSLAWVAYQVARNAKDFLRRFAA